MNLSVLPYFDSSSANLAAILDSTKSDSVTITVKEGKWSDSDKAMMEEYLGEVVPYFPGSFKWTDEYYDWYGVLSAESSNLSDLDKVSAQFKADSSFDYYYDAENDCDCFTRDSATDPLYNLRLDVYVYEDEDESQIATVDAYVQIKSYETWPTELISDLLDEAGFDITLPSYTPKVAGTMAFTAEYGELEDGGECVQITAYGDEDATDTAEDYVAKFDETSYKIQAYDDGNGGLFYLISDNEKNATIQVANVYDIDWELWDYVQVPGFEVMVLDYVADYSLDLLPYVDMVAVEGKLQMDLVKGEDFGPSDVVVFESSNDDIATVSQSGLVTGVAPGDVEIRAYFGDKAQPTAEAVSLIHVVSSIPEDYTQAQLDEFNKLHPGADCKVPFNKYYNSVTYDETEETVFVSGMSITSDILEGIYGDMIADGWVDIDADSYAEVAEEYEMTVDEARIALFEQYKYYSFEKEVDGQYYVSADLYMTVYDKEEEEDVLALEGNVHVDIYDVYFYSYSDAKSAILSLLEGFEVETIAELPDSLPGSHYYVDYDDEYNSIDLYAYDATGVTLDNLKTALEAKDWAVEIINVPATATSDAYSYLFATSVDEVLEIEGHVEDGMVSLYTYLPSNGASLLMDIDDLEEGDFISFGCIDKEVALGALSGKFFTAVDAEFDERYSLICDDALVFQVGVSGNYFTFTEVESGGVLATSANKNANLSGTGTYTWSVSIDEEGNATVASSNSKFGSLQYNAQDPRFLNYTSAQTPIQIFVW